MVSICSALALSAFMAPTASAQSNPFMPPQQGMSRAQIQEIVRAEVERTRAQQTAQQKDGKPPVPGQPGATPQINGGVGGLPQQQGGQPSASTAANGNGSPAKPAEAAPDPVAELMKDGGTFVGCVSGTPIFKDQTGRRAYFTTKELRESNAARRFTRCS